MKVAEPSAAAPPATVAVSTTSNRAGILLYSATLAALLVVLVTSPLRSMVHESRSNYEPFESLNQTRYDGFPIDPVNARLLSLLPVSKPIALGPQITRLRVSGGIAAGIYPRLPDRRSPYRLDIAPLSRTDGGVNLARYKDGVVRLYGVPAQTPPRASLPADGYAFSWMGLVLGLAAVAGLGMAACRLLSIAGLAPDAEPVATASVAGVLVFAVAASLGTWLQIPVSWRVLVWAGAAAFLVFLAIGVRAASPALVRVLRTPEVYALAALLIFLFVYQAHFPISSYDPRTIWMLAAKRLAHDGMITRQNMLAPALARTSHPGYPPLYPATMAAVGAHTPLNERMLAMGVPLLFALSTVLVWLLSRRVLGRFVGLAFTVVLALSVPQLAAWGNADPFVLMFLAAGMLGLANDETRTVGWMALAAASLTKQEGLLFAAAIGGAFIAIQTRLRPKEWRQGLALLWLTPAAIQIVLVRLVMKLPEDFSSVAPHSLGSAAAKSHAIVLLKLVPWTLGRFPLLWMGLIALPLAIVLCISPWRTKTGIVSTVASVAGIVFFVGLMFTTPIRYTRVAAGASLYRLFLHSSALAIIGVLAPLRSVFPAAAFRSVAKRYVRKGRYALADLIDPRPPTA